jgi:sulfatase modifying factor 1
MKTSFMKSILLSTVILLNALAFDVNAGENYAFLVAVQDYDVKQLKPLQFTRNDILEFRDLLLNSGYKPENVVVLHDDTKALSKLRFASLADNIRKEYRTLLATLDEDDSLIVAFAGHGVQYKDGQESYFCPADADLEDPKRDKLISLSQLYSELKACTAKKKLLLVDACRNNPQSRIARARTKVELKSVTRPLTIPDAKGVIALFSCSPGQEAHESPDLKHGVFFYHVLETWKDSRLKELTLDDLVAATKRETKTFARVKLGAVQTPWQRGYIDGSWTLRKTIISDLLTNNIGIKLKLIPAGEYLMGSGKSAAETARLFDTKAEYYENEHPQHSVKISKPFYLQTTEVTQGQWESVMRTAPWKGEEFVKEGSDYAASYVSWDDATEYCRKLSQKEGHRYRLPTEVEWEYACRAGSTTIHSFDDDAGRLGEYAWFSKNSYDADEKYAHRVGLKKPNAWGLFDMHGNVYEWCQDWFGEDYYGKSPKADPQGPPSGSSRVLRGGSWHSSALFARSAYRDGGTTFRRLYYGFRVVCELE